MNEAIKRLIAQLGGTATVAQQIGTHRTTVWRWTRPGAASVPSSQLAKVFALATKSGVPFDRADFTPDPEST